MIEQKEIENGGDSKYNMFKLSVGCSFRNIVNAQVNNVLGILSLFA